MTRDTTFKEFLAARGVNMATIDFDSKEYREWAKQFNEAKLRLIGLMPEPDQTAEDLRETG